MTDLTPVKGTVWLHARRKNYDGSPLKMTVTSVNHKTGIVYSNTAYTGKVKTPVALFSLDKLVKEVVSVPDAKATAPSVHLGKQACFRLHRKAHLAGMDAGGAAVPTPMHVVQRANPWDDNSPVIKAYAPVMGGVCGFAWIKIRPARGSFVTYLKGRDIGYKSYTGGWDISVHDFNQSMERKIAYASAYVKVLAEAGIDASVQSRMD